MKKRLLASLLLVSILFSSLPIPALAKSKKTGSEEKAEEIEREKTPEMNVDQRDKSPSESETITITNAGEFLSFAKNCSLDTWSENKLIILANDITLTGDDFTGIPTFNGIFDGTGHKIDGLNISSSASYCGLFSTLQKSGVVKNLNVEGNVTPSGNATFLGGIVGDNNGLILNCGFEGIVTGNDYIGGITGNNELNGIIYGCRSGGYVKGVHFTGGIAGCNHGNIADSTNECMVNVTNIDDEVTFESVERINTKVSSFLSIFRKDEGENDEAIDQVQATDVGGVVGISTGVITSCLNNGNVGYEHVGYNIGGIAGRQSGYITDCTNNGTIRGRKDVGGITGQAEPYIYLPRQDHTARTLPASDQALPAFL